jgi:hypothetical protein
MSLADSTQILLGKQDVAQWLKLVDKYMEVYRTDKHHFSLSEEHRFLEPVVKYYARRPKGFARYILTLRDSYSRKEDNRYGDLNKLYRTVLARTIQQERRARADRAVDMAIEKYGPPPSFSARLSWVARREADWAGQRLEYLANVRQKASDKKLSREETNSLLEQFWLELDDRITTEGVPPWDQ